MAKDLNDKGFKNTAGCIIHRIYSFEEYLLRSSKRQVVNRRRTVHVEAIAQPKSILKERSCSLSRTDMGMQNSPGVPLQAIQAPIGPNNVDFDADNLVDAIQTESVDNLQSITEDTPVQTILVRRSYGNRPPKTPTDSPSFKIYTSKNLNQKK